MEVALSLDFQVMQTGQTFLVHAKSKAHTLHAVKVVSLWVKDVVHQPGVLPCHVPVDFPRLFLSILPFF